MTPPAMSNALVAEHIRDLERAAARHRLAVASRGSRPSAWQRAMSRATAAVAGARGWVRRGQVGPTSDYCVTC